MAVVFVPRETEPEEARVAATPETVRMLTKLGLEVTLEAGAGQEAGFLDEEYARGGATIVAEGTSGYENAALVLKIRAPRAGDEASRLQAGATLVCGLQPLLHLPLVEELIQRKVTCFAMDLMPRITRAQKMDVLSSQATVAGYHAVLAAATHLRKLFPLLMTAAGTITPAKVLVLGAGVAGLQAIATARRLGAVVEANDIRPTVREQVESLGAKFVDTGTPPRAETTGGYAKETTQEYARKQREILTQHIEGADVVITTALIPGRRAPVLVSDDMVARMSPGSVMVDLAVEMGGNIEGSVAGQVVQRHGVSIVGDPNLASRVATDASRMYARNLASFIGLLVKEGEIQPDWEDEIIISTLVTRDGEVRHDPTAQAMSTQKGAT